MMKIVIDEKIPFIKGVFEPWADVVYSPGRAIDPEMVSDADALIVRTRTRCDRRLLEGSRVRIVASATIGFDHLDTVWLEKAGIRWVNAPGCNSGSVMQYITAALFLLASKHSLDLPSLTLGVVGVGNVGSKVVRAARAVGMKVLQNDPPRERREGGEEFLPLEDVLSESDILTLHVPLTPEGEDRTVHLLNSTSLGRLKGNCILINTSRGEVVDNKALRLALEEKRLAGAVLDVWEGEPETDRRLVELVDIATPHIAGYSVDGKANATVNSVREVAASLGIPLLDWTPASLPLPPEPLIDLTHYAANGGTDPLGCEGTSYPVDGDTAPPAHGETRYPVSGSTDPQAKGGATPKGSGGTDLQTKGGVTLNGNGSTDHQAKGGATTPVIGGLSQLVATAVRHTYPLEDDDRLFREDPEKFEYLRDNYRIRREFDSYSVRNADQAAAQILTDLGFNVMQ